jgi:hypothetical protein
MTTCSAIMTVQPPSPKTEGIARHQLTILAVAFPAIMLGATAIYYKKEASSAEHITTWHAVRGLAIELHFLSAKCLV